LIVDDAVAHDEGPGVKWGTRRAFWEDRAAHEAALRTNLLSLETTRFRHVDSDPNPEKYDPDFWTHEYAFLNRPAGVWPPRVGLRGLRAQRHPTRKRRMYRGWASLQPAVRPT